MEQRHFEQCVRDIFSAHGRNAPTGIISMAIWKRVKQFPDEFMTWAVFKLADNESLPRNIGYELERVLFSQWRAEFGKTAPSFSCPDCDAGTPGFFMVWDKPDHRFVARCACNRDSKFDGMETLTRAQAISRGWSLSDPMAPMPAQDSGRFMRATRSGEGRQRQGHLDALADAEGWA